MAFVGQTFSPEFTMSECIVCVILIIFTHFTSLVPRSSRKRRSGSDRRRARLKPVHPFAIANHSALLVLTWVLVSSVISVTSLGLKYFLSTGHFIRHEDRRGSFAGGWAMALTFMLFYYSTACIGFREYFLFSL